jgi:glycosyltransferase involved in cell wall biosynthesis
MKALFLIFHGFDPSNGISKKIHYQVKALKACGLDVGLCYYNITSDGHRQWKVDDEVIADLGRGVVAKLKKRFDYSPIMRYVENNNLRFVYMRSDHNANPFTIRMVKSIKKTGAKIVMEIPTFPYDQEYVAMRMKMELAVDRLYRHDMAMALDGIVTFSNAETIFGKKTIRISNGIDFDSIPLKQHQNDTSKELHLIGVAEIHFWHGFDRILKGMAKYYRSNPDYKVYFHVVGYFYSQAEHEEFVQLIQSNNLQSYVILHGAKHGKELDDVFEKADFAVGSLGRHRSGITYIKTLKNREYAARGFSFIYSEMDSDFDSQPYVLKAPADESMIDIKHIVDFYKSVEISPAEIRASVKNLSWTVQMQSVLKDAFY